MMKKYWITIFFMGMGLFLMTAQAISQGPFDLFPSNIDCGPNGTPVQVRPGAWLCRCPDGRFAGAVVVNGRWVARCPQSGYAPPAPQPRYSPPAPAMPDRTCFNGREMFRLLNGNLLEGRSLRTGNPWTGMFYPNGRVVFEYANGSREVNYWSVVGFAILLRRTPRGRVIARRRICWDANGNYYWSEYESHRPRSVLLNLGLE